MANRGLTDLDVQALALGPAGKALYAGTFGGGVFVSRDGGERWRASNAGLKDLDVRSLVPGPDGRWLYAGTGNGVFRSDDGGDNWQDDTAGLAVTAVQAVAVDGQELLAGAYGGVFRSGGEGWTLAPGLDLAGLPSNAASARIRVVSGDGEMVITRPGAGWLLWATFEEQAPQAFSVDGRRALLYTPAGAGMLLRAEAPLPSIWSLPTPYVAAVSAVREWLERGG